MRPRLESRIIRGMRHVAMFAQAALEDVENDHATHGRDAALSAGEIRDARAALEYLEYLIYWHEGRSP